MDSEAVNFVPNANVPADATCVFTGCMDTRAVNYNPTADLDDGRCIFLRSSATIATFGYMTDCHTFMDLDGDILRNATFEPHSSSDQTGFYSIVYREPGYGVVQQASLSYRCVDSVLGAQLSVPMLTTVQASMATPSHVNWMGANE